MLDVGMLRGGAIEVNHAQNMLACQDRRADHGAYSDVLDAAPVVKALVPDGVGAEHALVRLDHVVDDAARGADRVAGGLGPYLAAAKAYDRRQQLVALLVADEDDAAVCGHLLEHDVHHALQELVGCQQAPDHVGQLADGLPGLDGVSGVGSHRHDAVVGRGNARDDRAVHGDVVGLEQDQIGRNVGSRELLDRIVPGVHQQRAPDLNLVSVFEPNRLPYAIAVDAGAVGAVEVPQDPGAVLGSELGVAARHGLIGQRCLVATAPQQDDLVADLDRAALVGALEDIQGSHGALRALPPAAWRGAPERFGGSWGGHASPVAAGARIPQQRTRETVVLLLCLALALFFLHRRLA
jgi:hypothetical protein